jgi:hypothetical protein
MQLLKFVIGVLGLIALFVIAVKLLGLVLGLMHLVFNLFWLALVIGFFVLVGWVIYKLVVPSKAETF